MSGGLYTSRMRYDTGYFRGKRAMVSITTGAPEQAFGPGSRGGDFDVMLWPVQYSLHYMGFTVLPPFISYGVQGHGYSYEGKGSLKHGLRTTSTPGANACPTSTATQPCVSPAGTIGTKPVPRPAAEDSLGRQNARRTKKPPKTSGALSISQRVRLTRSRRFRSRC